MNPVRDDRATITCACCRRSFVPQGRQRYCDTTCRQTAWRRLHAAPVPPLVIAAKASTVYECDTCGNRYLGTQHCEDCNTFARKIGPGGCCPYCHEPVALADIIDLDQMRPYAVESTRPNHVSNVSVQPGQPHYQRVKLYVAARRREFVPGLDDHEGCFHRRFEVLPGAPAQVDWGNEGTLATPAGDPTTDKKR